MTIKLAVRRNVAGLFANFMVRLQYIKAQGFRYLTRESHSTGLLWTDTTERTGRCRDSHRGVALHNSRNYSYVVPGTINEKELHHPCLSKQNASLLPERIAHSLREYE